MKPRTTAHRASRSEIPSPKPRAPKQPRITERENPASASLDTKSTREILRIINREDGKVAAAVAKVIREIARAVDLAVPALAAGGRLIYIGAGTSGRLGVLDAAECIPTFGTDRVVAVMAGGPAAMFRPAEVTEDDPREAIRDLRRINLNRRDVLLGVSASGRTPYTLGGLRYARKMGAKTLALTSNPKAPIRGLAQVAIVPVVGPEVIAGSTRMKAGTAQKLVLNMLSTATMVRLGRVLSNWMINLRVSNQKLWVRARAMLAKATGISSARAGRLLRQSGRNLPVAILMASRNISRQQAISRLESGRSSARVLRQALSRTAPP